MQNVFIFHCSNGTPESNWYQWLKQKLEEKGFKVFVPKFPIGEKQSLNNWLNALKPYKQYLNNSILIGHSLGVPFILNVLNSLDTKIKATYLVAGFIGRLDNVDEPNIADFAERDLNWQKIKNSCQHFYIFHSNNDCLVPLNKAQELSKYLETKVILVENANHFRKDDGYKKFDLLLEYINL